MTVLSTGTDIPAFTLLGPVEATLHGMPVPLGPPQRRAVLVPLLLGAGRVCSTDHIIDAVWGAAPPGKAYNAVQAHISVLRRMLEPERAPREPSRVIQSIGRGYVIGPREFSADAFQFRQQVGEAATARAQGDVTQAAKVLREALDLWHGPALLDVPGPFAQAHRERLAEERLAAYEELVDLELAAAKGPLDHDLTELLREHPHRERLHGLHMRLLHHNGRRPDALAAYAAARKRLAEDLGLDPGPELQALHRAILADDHPPPRTEAIVVSSATASPTARTEPGRLPQAPVMVGRTSELSALATLLRDRANCPRVLVVHGIPGVGTTALALSAAAQFPGARYLLSSSSDGAERAAVLGRIAAGDRSLLVLDGAVDPRQAELGLPTDGRCTLLITGNNRMRALPFVTRVELRPLDVAGSRALLRAAIGDDRADSAPAAFEWLAEHCGGLPKVLQAVADYLTSRPEWDLGEYVDNLIAMQTDDYAFVNARIRPFFEAAYSRLPDRAAHVLRTAALHPLGTFSMHGVAAMLRRPVQYVELVLDELVDHNLLDGVAPGRYRYHPLVRQFALGRSVAVDPVEQQAQTRHRLAQYFLARLRAAVSGKGTRGPEYSRTWVSEHRTQLERLLARLPQDSNLVRESCALLAWLQSPSAPVGRPA
ncbi:BTAD domain-containing putative transcriptional regulator [Labedaea rhizosphaerae]|uniref:DNA-binding SARP family transcriptional activator n=1 Tax=Labedaea rhizosphaerae TaxID=598644 RepID=A0A4V3CZC2_LABRH|nr:BTAD domain-containing putative transcriptional regulator [Labedaea rhizosphaerae]TDP97488.1 DNA-binding SARP family transcriptional activator [Labedaea rhizosphaerae]